MLIPISVVILASQMATPVADTFPTFQVSRNCNYGNDSPITREQCVADENQARNELQPQWSQFDRADKAACIKETSMDGTPSYVELLTCLEMARDAKKFKNQ